MKDLANDVHGGVTVGPQVATEVPMPAQHAPGAAWPLAVAGSRARGARAWPPRAARGPARLEAPRGSTGRERRGSLGTGDADMGSRKPARVRPSRPF